VECDPEEVREAEEPDAEAHDVDEADGDELAPGPVDHRFLEGFGRVGEHVEQEEDQDARRQTAEEGLEPEAPALQTAEREPEEDREPRHRPQGDRLPCAHPCPPGSAARIRSFRGREL
jgi:hypothetical protein